MKLTEIAHLVNGTIIGSSDVEIKRLAKIEEAGPGDITFLSNPRYKKYLITTLASAILINQNAHFEELEKRASPLNLVKVSNPYSAFLQLLDNFYAAPIPLQKGIHPTAIIAENATISPDASIGPLVVINNGCIIEKNVSIFHGTVIGDDVLVGDDSILYPNVTIREGCKIGRRVIINAGTVIGSDGFGFVPQEDGSYKKIPQRGIVVIEDDVEIGANCTIDRATIGETKIHRGVKLDNLIHIAHNVAIGEHTIIAAQTGISGSTKIGEHCIFAGQVGLVGHIEIADRTTILAQSGISKSVSQPEKTYFGYPAKERHESLRIEGALRQLPGLLHEIRRLQERINDLEERLERSTSQEKSRKGNEC